MFSFQMIPTLKLVAKLAPASGAELILVRPVSDTFDDKERYELNVWVESTKSLDVFEQSLAAVIAPLVIRDHRFALGEIDCIVHALSDNQPPSFPGIPAVHYSFRIDVPTTPWNFWAHFDRILAFAIASGLRSKFSCRYLVTADLDFFALFSGTNLPFYFNDCFPPLMSGELAFALGPPNDCHRVSIPRA